jgi:hypothetical protein
VTGGGAAPAAGWRAAARNEDLALEVSDYFAEQLRWFERKARWKKIVLLKFSVRNESSRPLTLRAAGTRLVAGGVACGLEPREEVVKRLRSFQWDFLLYLIVSLNWIEAAIDFFFLATMTLGNRRLARKLRGLLEGDVVIPPGGSHEGILAFRGARAGERRVELEYAPGEGPPRQLACRLPSP